MGNFENNNEFERNNNYDDIKCETIQEKKIGNVNTLETIRINVKRKWKVLLPPLLAMLVYANGLTGDFVHDDIFAIKRNRDVTGNTDVADVFLHDFWGTSMSSNSSHKSYRPLTILTFRYLLLSLYLNTLTSYWRST